MFFCMIWSLGAESNEEFNLMMKDFLLGGLLEPILIDHDRFQTESFTIKPNCGNAYLLSELEEHQVATGGNPFGPIAHTLITCLLDTVHLKLTTDLSTFITTEPKWTKALLIALDNATREINISQVRTFLRAEPKLTNYTVCSIYVYLCARLNAPMDDIILSKWTSNTNFETELLPFLTFHHLILRLLKYRGLDFDIKWKLLEYYSRENDVKLLTASLMEEGKEDCIMQVILYSIQKEWNAEWLQILSKQQMSPETASQVYDCFLAMVCRAFQEPNSPTNLLENVSIALIQLHGKLVKSINLYERRYCIVKLISRKGRPFVLYIVL